MDVDWGRFRAFMAGVGLGGADVAISGDHWRLALVALLAAFMAWSVVEAIGYVGRHLRVSWEREARHADH